MRIALSLAGITLVVVGSCSPLLAKSRADKAEEEIRKITYDYAKCVVRNKHDKAAEVILSNFDNAVISKKFSALIDSECMGKVAGAVQVTFPADMYRYALADALVNMDFVTREEKDFSNRLPLAHPSMPSVTERDEALASTKSKSKRAEIEKHYSNKVAVGWLSRFGECIVRRDPIASRYWLLTIPNTPEEISRIDALRPIFSECLGDGTMKFNRITLRGTVALNYYRLAMATPQIVSGSTH